MEKEIIEHFQSRGYEAYTGNEVASILMEMTKPKRKSLDLSRLSRNDVGQVMRIVEAVEHVTGMHFDEINVKRRTEDLVTARHLFMYMLREQTKMTLSTIGKILGGRDHSTIIHGVCVAEYWIANPTFYRRENKLINDTRRYLESSEGGQG